VRVLADQHRRQVIAHRDDEAALGIAGHGRSGCRFAPADAAVRRFNTHEQVLGGNWHRFAFVGDISYSTYMLHFPMQLALALVAVHYALTPAAFENPVAMILFYAALIALGGLSFHYFERPMQNLLRGAAAKKSLAPEN